MEPRVSVSQITTFRSRFADDLRGAVHWKFGLMSGSYDFEGVRLGGQVAANP